MYHQDGAPAASSQPDVASEHQSWLLVIITRTNMLCFLLGLSNKP